MKKITILIKDESLIFKYRANKPVATNLLNTNVISNNELVFSDDYIAQNKKIVGLFICDLVKEQNITNIIINNNDMALLILDIFKDLKEINCLSLHDDETISFELCEKISKTNNIKKINCYSIPTFLIEMLDKNGIEVESRNEVLFTSNFMLDNELSSYSLIYYKKSINFGDVITNEDLEDFKSFCNINKYLKVIHLDKYNKNELMKIIYILKVNKRKNISIQLHDDINDPDVIEELKSINKKASKLKIKLKLVYSKDYLEKNYIKQIIFTTLSICSIVIFLIIVGAFGYLFYDNYKSEKKTNDIVNKLEELTTSEDYEYISEPEIPVEDDSNGVMYKYINNYDRLLSVNSDTVGWLTVKGTNINYPVVQTVDNSYYLKRDFYKEKDANGWVFMDFRNSNKSLDHNTIIYAHNRYYSGVMFGTLNRILEEKYYTNDNNLYITFNTMYNEYSWKIFSVYSIDVTSDYLYTYFDNDNSYQNFINLIKNRSDIPLNTEVTTNDKILTLSTCLDDNRRLVVHAVLQNN
ncbi:MAG: class B sortase [Candidatus Coprovivens sp.]